MRFLATDGGAKKKILSQSFKRFIFIQDMKGAKVGGRWTQSWWLSLAIGDIGGTDCRAAERVDTWKQRL